MLCALFIVYILHTLQSGGLSAEDHKSTSYFLIAWQWEMDLFVFLTRYLEFRGHALPDFYFFKVGQILNLNKLILSILNVLRAGVAFVHFGMAICSWELLIPLDKRPLSWNPFLPCLPSQSWCPSYRFITMRQTCISVIATDWSRVDLPERASRPRQSEPCLQLVEKDSIAKNMYRAIITAGDFLTWTHYPWCVLLADCRFSSAVVCGQSLHMLP